MLDFARQNIITLYTSPVLLDELDDVLSREKFVAHLAARHLTPHCITQGYAALAQSVDAPVIARTVPNDPDDDVVIACALAAQVRLIVSGDSDLLILHPFQNIAILKPSEAVDVLRRLTQH